MALTDLERDLLRRPIPPAVLASALAQMDGRAAAIKARYDSQGRRVVLVGDLCEKYKVPANQAARQVRAALDELRGLVAGKM
ncbi:MAG: hypothetical protein ACYSVY_00310 [Planctomycetota bacterium]|jgi:hypothetical protein